MKTRIANEIELLSYLKEVFPSSSSNTLRKMLSLGRVKINGEIIHAAKQKLLPGDTFELLNKATIE